MIFLYAGHITTSCIEPHIYVVIRPDSHPDELGEVKGNPTKPTELLVSWIFILESGED